ncbi:conjugal transfer protein TrbF [Sphingomonas abietis]|uniref:Conjugal transfer protein TrbF n=1 Tax=Sphingomonas abietis TaxID=3012344 RepID=A0ABY7NTW0_9SPHN|nr:conjugal transfer protein TrbF [Sphingomonas abietis]WBO24335.1 conjugal transfer protein TrbF [Sphingomonas abietis]
MSVFKRSLQRYGQTPEPETPYSRAGQLWDERIGSARVQARNWRLMAFGCLAISGGLAVGNVWQSLQSRVTPYVVEVDKLGEARGVAPALQNYQPSDGEIAWYLGRFITDIRSVSTDPVLVKRNWLEAYDFATERAGLFLNDYARSTNPFAAIGEHSVSVQITSVVRASDTSFQVKWTESAYDRGSLAGTTHWTAILTLTVRPPKTADALRRNPLGIFVNAIDWSRELDPPSAVSASQSASTPAPAQSSSPSVTPIAAQPAQMFADPSENPVPDEMGPVANEGGNIQ